MYKCYECGEEFNLPNYKEWEEEVGEYMGRPAWQTMRLETCPSCGSEEINEGYECECCHSNYAKEDYCDECKAKLQKAIEIASKETGIEEDMLIKMIEEVIIWG